jgi:hypothetical protein
MRTSDVLFLVGLDSRSQVEDTIDIERQKRMALYYADKLHVRLVQQNAHVVSSVSL